MRDQQPSELTQGAHANSVQRLVRRFRENRDREYLQYIDALRQKECLGWEAKIKTGVFGGSELNAHCKANEHLGRHLAWNMAIDALLESSNDQALPRRTDDA